MPHDQPNPLDQTINCRDCRTDFLFTAGEQSFFAERQFTPPTRCKACRMARKAEREGQTQGVMAPSASTGYAPLPGDGEKPRGKAKSRRERGGGHDRDY